MYYNSEYTSRRTDEEFAEGRASFFTKTYGIMMRPTNR